LFSLAEYERTVSRALDDVSELHLYGAHENVIQT